MRNECSHLVITRRDGESFFIGKDYESEITVLEVVGRRVRIGIRAPKRIGIVRKEILKNRRKLI